MEAKPSTLLNFCAVCGGERFTTEAVLWPELIAQWELSSEEVDYIDLQQGLRCAACGNNLRAMTLARAMTKAFRFPGTFAEFCRTDLAIRSAVVVEINSARALSVFLRLLPRYQQYCFPQTDLRSLPLADSSTDVMIHSDTLEHVPNSLAALKESYRVLKPAGHLFYTVPIVVGRLTRRRTNLPRSYHGKPADLRDDYVVETEYGADFWCELFTAGFREISLTSLIFPASVAIHAAK
jgi:SAM-dependent methyltransferase